MRAWFWLLMLALSGCGFGDATLEELDPEVVPERPTWSTEIRPLMDLYCTACHAEDAQPGAVGGLGYDTCEKTKSRRNWRGIVNSVFESNYMPPGGAPRVTEPHVLMLKRWKRAGFPCE